MNFSKHIAFFSIFFLIAQASFANAHTSHKKRHHAQHGAHAFHKKSHRHRTPIETEMPSESQDASSLTATLSRLTQTADNQGEVGMIVRSMKTGQAIYAYHADQSFVPASTMKIMVAEAALLHLGADYQFTTAIYTDAPNTQGSVLNGNIYVRFSGDPSLNYHDLLALFSELKNRYTSIHGNVIVDNASFDQNYTARGWNPKDLGYCFSAPIGSAIINQNCIDIKIASGKSNGAPIRIYPSEDYFYPPIHSQVITQSRSGCHLNLSTEQNGTLNLDGCMPRNRHLNITYVIPSPNAYSFALVKHALQLTGMSIQGTISNGITPAGANAIAAHHSEPLRVLIHSMLKKSNNIIASALYKKLGSLLTQRSGSWQNGASAVSSILQTHANLNSSGLRMIDGSGLSHDNLVTPTQMMQVLNTAYHSDAIRDDFIDALPIAGVDGTLKHRLYPVARKVKAKTGTVNGVASLAGYAQTRGGDTLAFVILMNGKKGMHWKYKGLEDKMVMALTQYTARQY